MAFPRAHWTRIYSTNILERLNKEVKRRTKVVEIFPDIPSVIRLVGTLLAEADDEWQISRRYSSKESMQQLYEPDLDLLAKLGDDRERFPSVASLQALAGTCPVTMASGKRKRVIFRHACDHDFRQIDQQWARCSLRKSVWAVAYWQQIRPRCASDHDAYRRLANRWLAVLWKLWHSRELYDETYHLQQRCLRSQPLA